MSQFPKQIKAAAQRMTSRTYRFSGTHVRVLVVDDDHRQAAAVSALLDADGFDSRCAFDGEGAFAQIDGWVPHIVLLDISMPVHDGFATARIFRRLRRTRDIVLVAYTALMFEQILARSGQNDFDAYFQKGGEPEGLLALIRELGEPDPSSSVAA